MLPLDLHVLSLSLAFILSQDQTLHCWFDVCARFLTLFLMLVSQILSTTCFFLFVPVQFYSKIDSLFYHAPKSAKGIAKVMRFYDMTKFLFKNFSHLSTRRCGTHCLESGCKDRTFSHHNQTFRQLFFMFFSWTLLLHCNTDVYGMGFFKKRDGSEGKTAVLRQSRPPFRTVKAAKSGTFRQIF